MIPIIMQMKLLPDGSVAACAATNGETQNVVFVAHSETGSSSGTMPYDEWDMLDDYQITMGKGRSGRSVYEHARQIALDNDEVWHPWEFLTITQMRIWKKLADALDKGDV